jgi:DHA1 family L-arabinose/isopropyl-beta-D-thiogalactopyranoside export protein-like MFS transporter/DHA1 family inner membrane transport protein
MWPAVRSDLVATARAEPRAWAALAALALGAFTYVTTELLPIGLLTSIAEDLHRSVSSVGLLVSGYAVVVVIVSLPLTQLTRTVSRRTLLAAMLAVLVIAALGCALAPTYELLFLARLVTALTQALFWAVVGSATVHLFPPALRGRALSLLFMGSSMAPVLGVPAGTWLGQHYGWRTAFGAMAVLAAVTCAAVAVLLPRSSAGDDLLAAGDEPHRRRYAVLVVVTAVAITGGLTVFTYITPFLLEVPHFAKTSLAVLLSVSGVAGLFGAFAVGPYLGRRSRAVMLVALSVQCATAFGLFALGRHKVAVVVLLAVLGATMSSLATVFNSRALHVAPGRTDMASAGVSSAFNVGIAAGSFLGGRVVEQYGVRAVTAVGGLFVLAALAIAAAEPTIAQQAARSIDGAP